MDYRRFLTCLSQPTRCTLARNIGISETYTKKNILTANDTANYIGITIHLTIQLTIERPSRQNASHNMSAK